MRKAFLTVAVFLLTCMLFAQVPPQGGRWPMTYEQMKRDIITHNGDRIPHIEVKDMDFSLSLQTKMVEIWITYFHDYAVKYGVPFICALVDKGYTYDNASGGTSYPNEPDISNRLYYVITFMNNPTYLNCTDDARRMSVEPKGITLLAIHELAHVAEQLEAYDTSYFDVVGDHCNYYWLKQKYNLLVDHGINLRTDGYY